MCALVERRDGQLDTRGFGPLERRGGRIGLGLRRGDRLGPLLDARRLRGLASGFFGTGSAGADGTGDAGVGTRIRLFYTFLAKAASWSI